MANTQTAPILPDRFIPFNEAYAKLCLGRTAAYGLVKTGKLKIIKLGRKSVCSANEVEALINSILEQRSIQIVTEEKKKKRKE